MSTQDKLAMAVDTLRPEVRKELRYLKLLSTCSNAPPLMETVEILTHELLRLATIEADALIALDCEHDWQVEHKRAEKAEAKLAALKARIAEAPVYEIPLSKPKSEDGWARVIESVKNERSVRGKRVRLIVEE